MTQGDEWVPAARPSRPLPTSYSRLFSRLAPHLRGHLRGIAAAFGLTFLLIVIRLLEPWPLKFILDTVFGSGPVPPVLQPLYEATGQNDAVLLAVFASLIILLAIASGLVYYWLSVVTARVGQSVVAGLRLELWDHIQALPWSFHGRRRTGDLHVRFTSDIMAVREALVSLPLSMAENGLLLIAMAVVMFVMDWRLALAACTVIPLLALLVHRYRAPMKEASRNQRRREGDVANIVSDALAGIRVIQAFGLEDSAASRFRRAEGRGIREGNKSARLEARLRASSEIAVGGVITLVVLIAAGSIASGSLTAGDLIVFVAYLRSFARPLRRVSTLTERAARTSSAGERLVEILDLVPEVRDWPGAETAPRLRGDIEFDEVSFAYRDSPLVLDRLALRIRPGEHVALMGATGSGKSTLAALIPRFHDPHSGRVVIDGRDVRDYTLRSLRAQTAVVFQEPILFATTIAENIAEGRVGASLDEVIEVARRSGIHEVISALPQGYDTVLGERGGTLSGGQRQCVAIARAMLRDAPILLLDEPTTGLDARSAAMVLGAIDELIRGRTVLMITHHLEQARKLDRIVILERGRIASAGATPDFATDPDGIGTPRSSRIGAPIAAAQ